MVHHISLERFLQKECQWKKNEGNEWSNESLHSAFPGSTKFNTRSTTLAYYLEHYFRALFCSLVRSLCSSGLHFACFCTWLVSFFSHCIPPTTLLIDLLTGVVFQCCKLMNFAISSFYLGKENYSGCFYCLPGKSMCFLVHSEIGNC